MSESGRREVRKFLVLTAWLFAAPWLGNAGSAIAETRLERGAYLIDGILACGDCHTPKSGPMNGVKFAGGSWFEMDGVEAYSANITSDRQTGIGKWSDRELIKAIREGRRPDGSMIGPPMPFEHYRLLSDRDVWAVVAYLRSVRSVSNGVPRSNYKDPLPPYYGPPIANVPEVPRANRLAYGAYLAGPAGRCIECHTPMTSPGGRDFANRLGAGGARFDGNWGSVVSSNITPDSETGIGRWSDGEIKAAIRKGVRPDGTSLKGPMPVSYYATITDEDLDAIVAYLRSLPPIRNEAR